MATELPPNEATFTVDEVLAATGGVLVRRGANAVARGVCTDSRKLAAGNLFVALRGGSFDGHAFVVAVSSAGAAGSVVSQYVEVPGDGWVVRVPDTLVALGKLAAAHRVRWARAARRAGRAGRIVAITGSAGKTTTSRAVTAALQSLAPGAVHSPRGNLNNQIGMPMVLLGLDASHAWGVVEIGTNSRGEIAYGASIAAPDVGVLTLVTCAHGEGLGALEDIAWEKGALLEAVDPAGAVVANGDDARASAQLLRSRARDAWTFGLGPDHDVSVTERAPDGLDAQRITLRVRACGVDRSVMLRALLLGEAGAYACAAGMAVAMAASSGAVDPAVVALAMQSAEGEHGRLEPRLLSSGVVVIDDAYNANPASMAASIRTAAELARSMGRELVLVLGEMRELGMATEREHLLLGAVAAASGAKKLVAVRGNAELIRKGAADAGADAVFVRDATEAAAVVTEALTGREIVLVKGSRAVALERVVAVLEGAERSVR